MRNEGYTLVELMVVISIIILLSVFAIINIRAPKEDKILKAASEELQNFLRETQTNASANTLCIRENPVFCATGTECNKSAFAYWLAYFDSADTVSMRCSSELVTPSINTLQKTYKLPESIVIDDISAPLSCTSSFKTPPFLLLVIYTPPTSQATFFDIREVCIGSARKLVIILKNKNTLATTSVTVEKGGNISVP